MIPAQDVKTVVITGVTGAVGLYLAEYILKNKPEVHVVGICRQYNTENIEEIRNQIELRECDLLDFSSILRVLKETKPQWIFHLAALECFDTPLDVVNNNIMSTANLLEAIRTTCPSSRIHLCSTSEVYGHPQSTPIAENHPLVPLNPYSASKLAQEALGLSYHKSWDLDVVITRMFTCLNPRRHYNFASLFAQQIAQIEAGKEKYLMHGNLESVRTLIDIRDAVRTYWLACNQCQPGVPYNIGGAYTVTVGEVLEKLIQLAKVDIEPHLDHTLLSPTGVTMQVPDTTRFDDLTKWQSEYDMKDSLQWLLECYRKREQHEVRL